MKRKILFFCHSMSGGGAEKAMETIIKNLPYDKYDVTVYSLHQECVDASWPEEVKYRHVFKHPASTASLWRRLWGRISNKLVLLAYRYFSPKVFYRLFVRGYYDVEIAFIEGYATRIISGSTHKSSKKIAWVHTDLAKKHWTKICYKDDLDEDEAYGRYDEVVCVSQAVKESTERLFEFIKSCQVLYNPIDEREVKRKSLLDMAGIPLLKRKCTLVAVGRLVPEKGFERLIEIMKWLVDDGCDVALNIIGEGIERVRLEKGISDNKLQEYVKLLGMMQNPYPYMADADIIVCSSRVEGFSTVITEALLLGKPIITTACAGVNEQLGADNKYGCVAKNDTRSLYDAIRQAIDDSNFINTYKQRAILRGVDFSLACAMKEIDRILIF